MKRYVISWSSTRYGKSVVEAESEKEAREKGYADDTVEDFEEEDAFSDWDIDCVEEEE